MSAFCIHLSLRHRRANEKIESEWWIYMHSLKRGTGAQQDYRPRFTVFAEGFPLLLQPVTS